MSVSVFSELPFDPDSYSSPSGASVPSYPPRTPVVVSGLILAATLGLFLAGSSTAHWVGYVLGAFGMSIATIVFRSVDLTRQRDSMYVDRPILRRVATGLLLAGIALAILHAFLALRTWEVA